jgi:hypothetical protein
MKKILGIDETLMRLESQVHPSIISARSSLRDHLCWTPSISEGEADWRRKKVFPFERNRQRYPLLGGFPPRQRTSLTGLPTAAKGAGVLGK